MAGERFGHAAAIPSLSLSHCRGMPPKITPLKKKCRCGQRSRGFVVTAGCHSCAACAAGRLLADHHALLFPHFPPPRSAAWTKGAHVRAFAPNEQAQASVDNCGFAAGGSRVTREMLHARTREMAVQAGRAPLQILQGDYERARIELTGETDMERQEAVLDAAPAGCAERQADDQNEGGWPFVLPPGTVLCKRPKNPSPNGSNCPPRAN